MSPVAWQTLWFVNLSIDAFDSVAMCYYLSLLQESGKSVEQKVQDALLSAFGKLKKDPIVCVDMQTKMDELGLSPFFPLVALPPYAAVCSGHSSLCAVAFSIYSLVHEVQKLATKVDGLKKKSTLGRPGYVFVDLREYACWVMYEVFLLT